MTILQPDWIAPPAVLHLSESDIHIWRADLNYASAKLQQLYRLLSEDEQVRAQRFHFERDRLQFVACRGILRCLLGQYLGLEPDQLRFCYGPQGKPKLDGSSAISTVQFNLSHSQGLALYAITRQTPIGIDLEYCKPLELETIAKSYFSSREYAQLSTLPPCKQRTAFFQLWTCKEAYLKATGQGLSGLEDAELSFQCNQPVLETTGTECWQLQSLIPAPRYMAAWAVTRRSWAIQFYSLDL